MSVFSDLDESHPHHDSIMELSDAGVVNGYSDSSFQPDRKVNRAEFLKILLEGTNSYSPEMDEANYDIYSLAKLSKFNDLHKGQWYIPYVRYAADKKIVIGYSNQTFRPTSSINLAEALKIIFKTYEIPTVQFIQEPDQWYEYYTATLPSSFEEMTLLDRDLDIGKNITRGELASMILYFNNWKANTSEDDMINEELFHSSPIIEEPFLLNHVYSNGMHTIRGSITYTSGCGIPGTSAIIMDGDTQMLHLEISETDPYDNSSSKLCTEALVEHPLVWEIMAEENAEIAALKAFGKELEFSATMAKHMGTHPQSPLTVRELDDDYDGMVSITGDIYVDSSCQDITTEVITQTGIETTIHLKFTTITNEGVACFLGSNAKTFEVEIPTPSNLEASLDGHPLEVNVEGFSSVKQRGPKSRW